MEDIFFNGVWRMDWGFGNPNKTATLIAELMVAVWGVAYMRRRGFWVALGLFIALGGCLIHTFSRGGLLAALVGLTAVICLASRPWPLNRAIAAGLAGLAIVAFAIHLNAHKRYGQGVTTEDRSISNRVELWRVTPAMMVDAPAGWGIGNSGNAFMQWYQPTQRDNRYRTLVNSHLTWLVEFGWPLRFVYIFAWVAAFMLCLPTRGVRWQVVPLGIWLAFGVAACFSSVAESPWLWILPGLSLAVVLGDRLRTRQWPQPATWVAPTVVASLVCASILLVGAGRTGISGSKDRVVIGTSAPLLWMVVDERVLGGFGFAKTLRRYLAEHPTDRSIGIVWSMASLPAGLSGATVVVTGSPGGRSHENMQRFACSASMQVLLSPGYYPQEAGIDLGAQSPVVVLFGEFSQSPFLVAWEETGRVRRVAGAGDFLPTWPAIVFGRTGASIADGG